MTIKNSENVISFTPYCGQNAETPHKYLIDEGALRYTRAVAIYIATTIAVIVHMGFNLYSDYNSLVIPTLVMLAFIAPFFAILLYSKKGLVPLLWLSWVLLIFAAYMLVIEITPRGENLFWLAILPTVLIFGLGFRYGFPLVVIFLSFMGLIFFTPLGTDLPQHYSLLLRTRLLSACIGGSLFSSLAEYVRIKTKSDLIKAIEQLEKFSLTDPLTLLGNRRDMQNHLEWQHAQAMRKNKPFSIAIVDADHFKMVNDSYGHNVGDKVLCHLAAVMNFHLRATDRLFRWGGEEFMILMPDTIQDDAFAVTERLRQAVEKTPYTLGTIQIHTTISIGLHTCIGNMDINEQVLIADSLLYKAKENGRNRVEVRG